MSALYARSAPFLLEIIELALLLAFATLSLLRPYTGRVSSRWRSLEIALHALARRKTLAVVSVGFLAFALRVALIPVLGIPQPRWNDEFSYLLAADTFAHGRLTNPTHPMWVHFESFHIIQQPTYTSMYPPGHGLALATGQVLGHPWIGQLIVTALMCAAICWMLQGWLPAHWALFGGMLAVLRLALFSYWINGYWCASLPALGGALVLGALPGLRRRLSVTQAVVLGLGLALLANTRPYEGFILSLPVAAALVVSVWKARRAGRVAMLRPLAALVLVIAATAALTGYYYHRVTGNAFTMTYVVDRATYATAPYFVWGTPRPEPVYHHAEMRELYQRELQQFENYRTVTGALRETTDKLAQLWKFYLGPALTLPLLALPWGLGDRRMRWPLLALATCLAALAVETFFLPHYLAPATALLYFVLLQCWRRLSHWQWRGAALGRSLSRALLAVCVAMLVVRVAAAALHAPIEPPWPRGNLQRATIVAQLEREPGKHLVIVSYGAGHRLDEEWVYNAAGIDASKIVWARDMGQVANHELIQYFHDRNLWRVDVDGGPATLTPDGGK